MKTEALVTQIFESVIGVRNLTPNARFIDIGGNSLNLVVVLKQIKEKTGVVPAPRMFFDKSYATIAAISAAIDSQRQASLPKATVTD
jgi:acyl carrier protein